MIELEIKAKTKKGFASSLLIGCSHRFCKDWVIYGDFLYYWGVWRRSILVVYLICVAIMDSVMIAEFIIGREGGKDAIGSYKTLAPKGKWYISGILGVGAAF